MKKPSCSSLEITDTHVKYFQAKDIKGQRVITACDVREIHGQTDDEIVNLIVDMIRGKTIGPDELLVAIPRRLAILKVLNLPSANSAELKKMIPLQLISEIPYAIEDVILDHQVIGREEGYTKVLAVLVHKDVSQRYIKIFQKAGVHPSHFTLSSQGIVEFLTSQARQKKITLPDTTMAINIDVLHTEICFIEGGKLIFSRSVNSGARDLNNESLGMLIDQIELSLSNYKKEKMGKDVAKMVFISALEESQALVEEMDRRIKLPIEKFSLLDNILTQKSANLSSLKNQFGLSLTVGCGLLSSDKADLLNFMPSEIHEEKKIRVQKKQYVQLGVLVLLIVGLVSAIFGMELHKKGRNLEALRSEAARLRPKLDDAKETRQSLNEFKSRISGRLYVPELITELSRLTPPEISFRSVTINESGEMSLQGYSTDSGGVNTFQRQLVGSRVFREVNLQFATKRRIFNMDVTDFRINAHLNTGALKEDKS